MKKFKVTTIIDYYIDAEDIDMADYQAQLDATWGTVEDNEVADVYVYDVAEVHKWLN